MSSKFRRAIPNLLFFFVSFQLNFGYAAEPEGKQTILILHSYNREYRWTEGINTGIMNALSAISKPVLVCTEYLDWKRFPDERNIDNLRETFREKYRNAPIDVIIASDDKALEFSARNRTTLFSNAPIVFTGVYPESVAALTGERKTLPGSTKNRTLKRRSSSRSASSQIRFRHISSATSTSRGSRSSGISSKRSARLPQRYRSSR